MYPYCICITVTFGRLWANYTASACPSWHPFGATRSAQRGLAEFGKPRGAEGDSPIRSNGASQIPYLS